jgi:hypothetical protein
MSSVIHPGNEDAASRLFVAQSGERVVLQENAKTAPIFGQLLPHGARTGSLSLSAVREWRFVIRKMMAFSVHFPSKVSIPSPTTLEIQVNRNKKEHVRGW